MTDLASPRVPVDAARPSPGAPPRRGSRVFLRAVNGRHHRFALAVFALVVIAHWAEHLAQAFQLWVLHEPMAHSRGALGKPFPWLVTSEWMHYGYAAVMLLGLVLLRPGFAGRARTWWTAALVIQFWHHFEHLLLLVQRMSGHFIGDRNVPSSLLQLAFPRVELHLAYNTAVTVPMVVAMILHMRAAGRREACR